MKKYQYICMMKSYKNYVDVLRNISKNFSDTDEFDDIIKYILIKLFDTYYLERDIRLYNIDNVFKKYNMNMYNILSKKYVLTKLIMLQVSNISWNSVRSLINGMFTNTHGGVSHGTLGFYGNDPVCLFKFFVSSDEPHNVYSWSLLATNFVCFGVISISYLVIFVITSASSLSQSQGVTGDMVRSRNNVYKERYLS